MKRLFAVKGELALLDRINVRRAALALCFGVRVDEQGQ